MFKLALQHEKLLLKNIPPIYHALHNQIFSYMLDSIEERTIQTTSISIEIILFSYSHLMEIFSEIASNSSRKEVKTLINKLFSDFNDLKIKKSNNPP